MLRRDNGTTKQQRQRKYQMNQNYDRVHDAIHAAVISHPLSDKQTAVLRVITAACQDGLPVTQQQINDAVATFIVPLNQLVPMTMPPQLP